MPMDTVLTFHIFLSHTPVGQAVWRFSLINSDDSFNLIIFVDKVPDQWWPRTCLRTTLSL